MLFSLPPTITRIMLSHPNTIYPTAAASAQFNKHITSSSLLVLLCCQQFKLRKKVLFYFQKLSSVPVTQLRRKSLQVLRFSHDLIRLFIKKLKKFHKKNIFSMILLAIILLPLKYPIWLNSKLRRISHFLQQINKWV